MLLLLRLFRSSAILLSKHEGHVYHSACKTRFHSITVAQNVCESFAFLDSDCHMISSIKTTTTTKKYRIVQSRRRSQINLLDFEEDLKLETP